jgi:hypothetical protein
MTSKRFTNERPGKGKALGEWIGLLSKIPAKKDGYSLREIAEYAGVDKTTAFRAIGDLMEPHATIKVGKQKVPFYAVPDIRDIGKDFNNLAKNGAEVFKLTS